MRSGMIEIIRVSNGHRLACVLSVNRRGANVALRFCHLDMRLPRRVAQRPSYGIAMVRQIVLPAALLVGVFGFFLWHEFHAKWGPSFVAENADAGYVAAQRRLASCYARGCPPNFIRTPVLACAWREIIIKEAKRASQQDLSAQHKACSEISGFDRDVLKSAEDNIRFRMSRIHQTQMGPKHANAEAPAYGAGTSRIAPLAPHATGTDGLALSQ